MALNRVTKGLLSRAADDASILSFAGLPDYIFGQHAQAAIEKYYKAMLNEIGIEFPRTHNLEFLYSLLNSANEPVPADLALLSTLTNYALDMRYDDYELSQPLNRAVCQSLIQEIAACVITRIEQISAAKQA